MAYRLLDSEETAEYLDGHWFLEGIIETEHGLAFCCEETVESEGTRHDGDCENYDGAPVEQWEVTTPDDVYLED